MAEIKGFLDVNPNEIEGSIKAIDGMNDIGFNLLNTWPIEQLKNVDTFVKFLTNKWKEMGKQPKGTERDQLEEIYQYLTLTITDCLGPMAHGQRMSEYFELIENAPIERIKPKLASLIDLARFLRTNSDELKPIIKQLAMIDKNFYDKSSQYITFKQLIEPLISLQINSILALVRKAPPDDKQMMDFIKDVKDKIINVNNLLEKSRLKEIQPISSEQSKEQLRLESAKRLTEEKLEGGYISDYETCKQKYLSLKK